jgi:phosphoketolase
VLFVADYNSAAVAIRSAYQTQGQIWTLVVPKADVIPDMFTPDEAARLLADGAIRLDWAGHQSEKAAIILTAVGAYQLEEVLRASSRLSERDVPHSVVYMLEPGRFRAPRSDGEREHAAPDHLKAELYPDSAPARVFVTHTRPEPLIGTLQPLLTGSGKTVALGFVNQGGTLSTPGMLFLNRCSWAHIVEASAGALGLPREDLLTPEELAALDGAVSPEGVIV